MKNKITALFLVCAAITIFLIGISLIEEADAVVLTADMFN